MAQQAQKHTTVSNKASEITAPILWHTEIWLVCVLHQLTSCLDVILRGLYDNSAATVAASNRIQSK